MVLFEYGHPHARLERYISGGRVEITRKDAQERGFARAVGADDAVAIARREFEIHILKQRLTAEVHTDICNC